MSSPLFRTEGFVYRAGSRIYDDEEDEDWVDRSLLTSPLDRSFGENPFEAGPSTTSFTNSGIRHSPAPSPKSEQEEPEEEIKPDIDDLDDIREDTPLREIDPDDLDAPEPEDERQCRICFSGREEEAALGRLISPCLCTGSVRYVHVSCINAWRGSGSNDKAFIECQQCHYHYHFRRTLISGLATSRPILLLSAIIVFTALTLFAGQILTWLLAIPAFHNRILKPPSPKYFFQADDDEWYDFDDSILYVSSGGTLMWDILIGSIRTFAAVANRVTQSRDGVLARLPGPVQWLGVKFLMGMAVLGSFSFLSLLLSLSLFGPLQLMNGLRGAGFLGNWTRRRRNAGTGVGQYMMIAIVLIGSVNTLISVYHTVETVTQRMLKYVETQILEVNPEDRRKAKERRVQAWWKRWLKEKRYTRLNGWQEVWVRLSIEFRLQLTGLKEKFTRWKTAWALGVDEDMLYEVDERI